jgi:hypothetical protein
MSSRRPTLETPPPFFFRAPPFVSTTVPLFFGDICSQEHAQSTFSESKYILDSDDPSSDAFLCTVRTVSYLKYGFWVGKIQTEF